MASARLHFACIASCLALAVLSPTTSPAQTPVFLTAWGTYGTGNGQFNTPTGVAVGSDGIVYAVDSHNNRVQMFTGTGIYLGQLRSQFPAPGMYRPSSVALDAQGNVYVSEVGLGSVQKYTHAGSFLRIWYCPASPKSLTVDPSGQLLVTTDGGRILKYTPDGALLAQWSCGSVADGVATDESGDIYVTNSADQVYKYSSDGTLLLQWGALGTGDGQFNRAVRLAVDRNGVVYVVDYVSCRIQMFTSSGAFIAKWGSPGSSPGQFLNPIGIAVAADGTVYVADTNASRIQVFSQSAPTPTQRTSWGRLKAQYH